MHELVDALIYAGVDSTFLIGPLERMLMPPDQHREVVNQLVFSVQWVPAINASASAPFDEFSFSNALADTHRKRL